MSPQSQAVMLLTVAFGKSSAKPLSVKEWARFAVWLKDHELEPSNLLKGDPKSLLSGWVDRKITIGRIEELLERGGALGLALEKWQRAGLWLVTRSDADYPDRLKRKLRLDSPPVLFGCGNRTLLSKGGVAVVGSRNANEDDIRFTTDLGRSAAQQGHSVVSGAARGVDENAMLGALQSEGTAIGVMADSLLRAATSAKYRKYLLSNDLVLVSPFNPEAGFNVGNAMARNKYIYCLSDAAVVVNSTPDKGGTWNGAIEDLKNQWVPLWVKREDSPASGNSALVDGGARWFPDGMPALSMLWETQLAGELVREPSDLLSLEKTKAKSSATHTIISEDEENTPAGAPPVGRTTTQPDADERNSAQLTDTDDAEKTATEVIPRVRATADTVADDGVTAQVITADHESSVSKGTITDPHSAVAPEVDETSPELTDEFYDKFLRCMLDLTCKGPLKTDEITQKLRLEKPQVNAWLKRAVEEDQIKKLNRPVRYQSASKGQREPSLFGD